MTDRTEPPAEQWVNAYVEGSTLVLFRRVGGQLVRHEERAEFSAFYNRARIEEAGLVPMIRESRNVRSCTSEGEFLRVCFAGHEERKAVVHSSKSPLRVTPALEGDIDPVLRHFVERGARVQMPRVAFFDIEGDSRVPFSRKEEARMLSWALTEIVPGEGAKVVASAVLERDSDAAEAEMIVALFKALEPFDLVAAWSGESYDFPVLYARAAAHRIRVDMRRWIWLDHLVLFKRMNTAAESGDEKASNKLGDVGSRILGETKDELDAAKSWEYWEAGGAERARLLKYNEQDARLLARLEEKTGFLALFFTLCDVCGVLPTTQALGPVRQMDGYMLRLGKERGAKFPTKQFREKGEEPDPYEGAYVMQPRTNGVETDVHVADFASLYPSIILTWNMSPETVRNGPVNGPVAEGRCRAPGTGVNFDAHTEGMLPTALRSMIALRKEWNDLKASLTPGTDAWKDADRRSTAYKVAANSFYGVIGSPFSRFFDRRVAESVTKAAQWLIKETIAHAQRQIVGPPERPRLYPKGHEKEGQPEHWRAIYADTDSVFVTGPNEEVFGAFVAECNGVLYPKLLAGEGCAHRSAVKLAYEKQFRRVFFTSAKRYAGNYEHYKGTRADANSKPEVRGLEYRRGDTALLARRLQEEIIRLIIVEGETRSAVVCQVVERYLAHVLQGDLSREEVSQAKTITKALREYATKEKADGTKAADIVHVGVAKLMADRGEEVRQGTKIAYVVTDGGPPQVAIPASDYTGVEADRYFLWENLVYPPTERVLTAAFPGEAEAWHAYARQRPKKPRGAAARATLSLFETGAEFPRGNVPRVIRSGSLERGSGEEIRMPRRMMTEPTEPKAEAKTETEPKAEPAEPAEVPRGRRRMVEEALPLPTDPAPSSPPSEEENAEAVRAIASAERSMVAQATHSTARDAEPTSAELPSSPKSSVDEQAVFLAGPGGDASRQAGLEAVSLIAFLDGSRFEEEFRRLEAELSIGSARGEHGRLAEALDNAETNTRAAFRLYATARIARKSREDTDEIASAKLRDDATKSLQEEKDKGTRAKAITDADISARMAGLFPDEFRAQSERRRRWEMTEKSLEHLVSMWESRCRSLQAMLSKSR